MKNNNLISEEKMNTMTKKLFSITSLSTNSPKPYPVIDMSKYALKEASFLHTSLFIPIDINIFSILFNIRIRMFEV